MAFICCKLWGTEGVIFKKFSFGKIGSICLGSHPTANGLLVEKIKVIIHP